MKILKAETAYGGIVVEYEMLGETHKLLYPPNYTDEQIKSELLQLEEGRKKRVALQKKHARRFELEASAQETCSNLTK